MHRIQTYKDRSGVEGAAVKVSKHQACLISWTEASRQHAAQARAVGRHWIPFKVHHRQKGMHN